MAAYSSTAAGAALTLMLAPRITAQMNRRSTLLYLLPVTRGEGKSCSWTAKFTGQTAAAAVTEGTARSASDAEQDAKVTGTLSWAGYDKVASVTDLAQAVAQSSVNAGSLIETGGTDLAAGEIIDAVEYVARGLASDLFAGDRQRLLSGAATRKILQGYRELRNDSAKQRS